MTLANLGTYGDFIGGFIGTIISLITLIAIFKSFKQANDQSFQSTIALLIQSYQHTIEDFDYDKFVGREAIKECLKKFKEMKNENEKKDFIENTFPTHIPAILMSILYSIKNSEVSEVKKINQYLQIKVMLSFEERQLLLLYLLELLGSENKNDQGDLKNDKDLLKLSIFNNGTNSKSLKGFDAIFNKIYDDGKQNN
jgi:hypothetical protein